MHHVPYTYRLHSGKTLMQYIYDTHYWGAQAAAAQVAAWESLHGKVPDPDATRKCSSGSNSRRGTPSCGATL